MSNSVFSIAGLISTVLNNRKELGYSQQELADKTGINRAMISRIEQGDYIPSIPQLESLSQALEFDIASLFVKNSKITSNAKVARQISLLQVRVMLVYPMLYFWLNTIT